MEKEVKSFYGMDLICSNNARARATVRFGFRRVEPGQTRKISHIQLENKANVVVVVGSTCLIAHHLSFWPGLNNSYRPRT